MINDMDCDVERLTPDDFESTDSMEMRLFVIEQAKLAEFGMLLFLESEIPKETY